MNNRLNIFWTFLLVILFSCGENKTIEISFYQDSSVLKYGVSKLEEHALEAGFLVQKSKPDEAAKGIIILSKNDSLDSKLGEFLSENLINIKDDGYKIIKNEDKIYIIGKSERGCLYGLLDVIEQIGAECDISKIEPKLVNPANAFRAVKINLPWSPYRPGPANDVHIETCKDLNFWEAFLDMCVKNRFNAVSLWNNHPFPYMVRAKNYPKATPFNNEELAEWQHFFKTIFKIKFNWSHGHSTPKLSLTHANDAGTIMKEFWDPKPENYFITWMVRNEDFFVLRWGDPEFIRDHINTNKNDYVQGYFIGSEGYIPAKDYSHIEPHPQKTWKYAFEKQWMFYHLWGRLLFDPNEKEVTLAKEIRDRYPKIDALAFLKAYSLASKVPLNIATFYKRNRVTILRFNPK
jgi:hypothetical protein